MPVLRQRKRPASPDAEPPKKAQKGKAKSTAQPISDDDNNNAAAPTSKAAPRGRKKTIKAEPDADDNDELDTGNKAGNAKGTGKVKPDAKAGDAQIAKADNLLIPVDETCPLSSYYVYVDTDDGIIYDAALNQTNAGNNNNKFYRLQLLTNGSGNFHTWTRWGRVGEPGQSKILGDGDLSSALKEFNKKFKDKSGLAWADRAEPAKSGKYVFVERSYEPDSEEDGEVAETKKSKQDRSRSASPAKCLIPPPVQSLMELIFNMKYINMTMADLNYDANKLPLGKLSKSTITRGYQALKDLAELLNDPNLAVSEHNSTFNAVMEDLSNRFYSYIPHAFGRNRPPVISSHEQLKREVELLESLTDLKDADAILKTDKSAGSIHPLDARFNGLGMQEMTPIERETSEFSNINDYLTLTKGATHTVKYELLDVFRIERQGELDRFKGFAKQDSDRRLLWHGSRATNYGGILSQGLRIAPPEAPVSGYMFGKGIYLADMSSKSANYCCHHASGGEALLLLCEAELGNPVHELTDASYTARDDATQKGLYSTWGKGQTGPKGWKDAKCVHPSLEGVMMPDTTTLPGNTNVPGAYLLYNEYIAYDIAQVRLRYLLRVKM